MRQHMLTYLCLNEPNKILCWEIGVNCKSLGFLRDFSLVRWQNILEMLSYIDIYLAVTPEHPNTSLLDTLSSML